MLKRSIFCWFNGETFSVYLCDNESDNENNCTLEGRINPKPKKFQFIGVNESANDNRTFLLMASSVVKGNTKCKSRKKFFLSDIWSECFGVLMQCLGDWRIDEIN